MAMATWLVLTESHTHDHEHEYLIHTHRHVRDEHHQHTHPGNKGSEPQVAAKAAPDGHNMVLHAVEHFINGSVQSKLSYDTVRDIALVSLIAAHALVLIVQPLDLASSPKEFSALAKIVHELECSVPTA